MGRISTGLAGHQLFNQQLYQIFQLIAYLNNDNDLNEEVPQGALKENGEDLLYRNGNDWTLMFSKRFKIFSEMLSEERPSNPIKGQLWIDPEGDVIWYFKNEQWKPIKTAVEAEYSINAYEQFLLIDEMEKGINTVVNLLESGYYEEHFLIKNNETTEIGLLYDIKENCQPCVFVNGRYVAQVNRIIDFSKNKVIFPEALSVGDFVTIQYMRVVDTDSEDELQDTYYTYNFSMIDQVREEVVEVTNGQSAIALSDRASLKYLNVYLNGRLLASNSYTLGGDNLTLRFDQPFVVTDEYSDSPVIIRYVLPSIETQSENNHYTAINDAQLRTQFLWPSSLYDRLFIDGVFTTDYQVDNKVSFSLDNVFARIHSIDSLHVNPLNIAGTTKKAIKINPTVSLYNLPTSNTEYYGIAAHQTKLLFPNTKDQVRDYYVTDDGVYFNANVLNNYPIIYCITYTFKENSGKGSFLKGSQVISDQAIINVNPTNETVAVFAQGLNLYQKDNALTPNSSGDFTYSKTTGDIVLDLTGNLNISVIYFPKTYYGFVSKSSTSVYTIPIPANLSKCYLVFFQGFLLTPEKDFTINTKTNTFIILDPPTTGGIMSYTVIDCTEDDGISKYPIRELEIYKEGEEVFIDIPYIDPIENSPNHIHATEEDLILFVDGLLVSKEDVVVNENRIYIKDLDINQKCLAITNGAGRYIYSNKLMKRFIGLDQIVNHLNVYCEGRILCDFSALAQDSIPTGEGYAGELRPYVLNWDLENIAPIWYEYDGKKWNITSDDSCNLLLGFIHDSNLFYIMNHEDYYGKKCNYFAYRYSSYIKHPITNIYLTVVPDKIEYYTGFNGNYVPNTNSLSVYICGVRQYPNMIKEISASKFSIIAPYKIGSEDSYPMLAVIEKPEDGELKSCSYQILTQDDLIEGSKNIYRTKLSLNPGIVRAYIGGIRQPSESIHILNKNNFYFLGMENQKIFDDILIEVRQDYLLQEHVIKASVDQQNTFSVLLDGIKESLIQTGDTVAIYINGLRYQGKYKINPALNGGTITLDNSECETINRDDSIIFEWR